MSRTRRTTDLQNAQIIRAPMGSPMGPGAGSPSSGPDNVLLAENGDYIITEAGVYLELEAA